tara:strand:- start:168 stop:521 length:354 start_codon:yes stop_codon:yes gene_type:complete
MAAKIIALTTILVLMSGCVSNKAVQTVQAQDYGLNCKQLQFEMTALGAKFEDTKDDSGITGKNVGLAVVFWPGILVNELRVNKNQDSISARLDHLSKIYQLKCLKQARESSNPLVLP